MLQNQIIRVDKSMFLIQNYIFNSTQSTSVLLFWLKHHKQGTNCKSKKTQKWIFIAKVSLTGLGFIKSDLYYSGSTMPLITFIILRKTIANCRRKCCYKKKNSKTELYRNSCLQTNYIRKCVKSFSKLFYCFILLQEQKTAEAFQTDLVFHSGLYFFIGLPART